MYATQDALTTCIVLCSMAAGWNGTGVIIAIVLVTQTTNDKKPGQTTTTTTTTKSTLQHRAVSHSNSYKHTRWTGQWW